MAETLPGNSFILKIGTIFNRPFFFGTAGATLTITLSKNGGTFAATSGGTVTDLTNGWYNLVLNPADVNTVGILAYHITGTAGGPADFSDLVQTQVYQDLALNVSNQVLVSSNLKQSQLFTALFFMTQLGSSNPAPGLTVTGQRAFGAGGFSNVSGTILEVGGIGNGAGWYVFNGTAADSASACGGYKMTAVGANDSDFTLWFQP